MQSTRDELHELPPPKSDERPSHEQPLRYGLNPLVPHGVSTCRLRIRQPYKL